MFKYWHRVEKWLKTAPRAFVPDQHLISRLISRPAFSLDFAKTPANSRSLIMVFGKFSCAGIVAFDYADV